VSLLSHAEPTTVAVRRTPRARLTPLTRYTLRTLAFVPVATFVIITLTFMLVNLIPSHPELALAGPLATDEQLVTIRAELGLDQPLLTRYGQYLAQLAHLDLGESYYTRQPVWDGITQRLTSTLVMVVLGVLVAAVLGIVLGTVGALYRGRAADRASRTVTTFTQVVPDFFLALLFIFFFYFTLRWAPAPTGQLSVASVPPPAVTGSALVDSLLAGNLGLAGVALKHLALPVLVLGIAMSAWFAKSTRVALGEALTSPQVEFARACGLPRRKVLGYAILAARSQIITYLGVLFAGALGSNAVIEIVFSWGGMGQYNVDRVLALDLPAIQGNVLVLSLMTLLVFVFTDLLVALFDPRVSHG
jgi:ABC-type dipeptide/oligopeptide/nickel transport system permease component